MQHSTSIHFSTIFYCLFLLLASIEIGYTQNESPQFEYLSVKDGLSQNLVYDIIQDQNGFLWFGTHNGLNRYDGYEFKTYYHDPLDTNSISGNIINVITKDRTGNLWIGADGLNRYTPRTDSFQKIKLQINSKDSLKHAKINSICEDQFGVFWIGTHGGGLHRIDITSKKDSYSAKISNDNKLTVNSNLEFHSDPGNPLSLCDNYVNALLIDHNNNLWIGTEKGLDRIDLSNVPDLNESNQLEFYHHLNSPKNDLDIPDEKIKSIYQDSKNVLWFGTPSGLFKLSPESDKFVFYPHSTDLFVKDWMGSVLTICEYDDRVLWLGTYEALCIFDRRNGEYQYIQHNPKIQKGIIHHNIQSIYKDEGGVFWLATAGYGINKHNPFSRNFTHRFGRTENRSPISVKTIVEDSNGLLWFFDNYSRVYKFNPSTEQLIGVDVPGISIDLIDMKIDNSGHIWFGLAESLIEYDPSTGTTIRYKHKPIREDILGENTINYLTFIKDTLWIVSERHISKFDKVANKFILNDLIDVDVGGINCVASDTDGILWIGSNKGLISYTTGSGIWQYFHSGSNLNELNHNNITAILADPNYSEKIIWIGTSGGGLNRFNVETGTFTHFTTRQGLPNNTIVGILADNNGDLWISTSKNLSKFNRLNETIINYGVQDGLSINEFNYNSYYQSSKGRMYFGGVNGLLSFHPSNIQQNPHKPRVAFTDFQIFYQSVSYLDTNSPLHYSISETKRIILNHDQNSIVFEFAAMDFVSPPLNNFAYTLENFDMGWIDNGANRRATYTNLHPGKYIFRVRASNNDGVWGDQSSNIDVVIHPPFWKTIWAYLLYIIIFFGIVIAYIRFRIHRIKERIMVKNERLNAEQIKKMDNLKTRFFTSITHEFRTPLSLILTPLENLLTGKIDDTEKRHLNMIKSNAQELLSLINQLLDIARLEAGMILPQLINGNIISFIEKITHLFISHSEHKNIKIEFSSYEDDIQMSFDLDMIKKTMYNLLSNALKFTPNGGKIYVSVEKQTVTSNINNFLKISVKDTGIGIPSDRIPFIFDRFYVAHNQKTLRGKSVGIGLSIVKELVELNKGTIEVTSKHGSGTTFTVKVPITPVLENTPFWKDEDFSEINYFHHKKVEDIEEPDEHAVIGLKRISSKLVLIVEDHDELRSFLRDTLSKKYDIIEAIDGVEGVTKAKEFIPNLIISDVMMQNIDGFDMISILKESNETSHIPIILLTAKAEERDKIKGLKMGADAYVLKPFSVNELLVRIENLIQSRAMLQERYAQVISLQPSQIQAESMDEVFLKKVLFIIENKIDDERFSVEALAFEIGMSPSQLYRKLRALTKQSTIQLIQNIRLQRAADLLQKNIGTVSEISYKVGFSSPAYFSSCFRKKYNCTPQEYRKREHVSL